MQNKHFLILQFNPLQKTLHSVTSRNSPAIRDASDLRFVVLPTRLDEALQMACSFPLDETVFFSEHWSQGRFSTENDKLYFSANFFREELLKIHPQTQNQTDQNRASFRLNISFVFNLFESIAATEDHDHYQSLSEIAQSSKGFQIYIYRAFHAITPFHLFSFKDYPFENLKKTVEDAIAVEKELIAYEQNPLFPKEAPKWAQTFSRRKTEILSIEHFQNFYYKRLSLDLKPLRQSDSTYDSLWSRYEKSLFKIYENEAGLRNQTLKESLFNAHPFLHDYSDFPSLIFRLTHAYFPNAHFILEEEESSFPKINSFLEETSLLKLNNLSEKQNLPPLKKETALQCLQLSEKFLQNYEQELKKSRHLPHDA